MAARRSATLPQALGRLRVALEDAYLRASREHRLTPQQAELLCAAMSPAAVSQLAAVLRCDRSNVTRLVDRAARRGLLERHTGEEDARVTVIGLTAEGEAMAHRFIASLEAQTRPLLERWSDRRGRQAVELLDELSDALDVGQPARRKRRRRIAPRPAARRSVGSEQG